MGESVGHWRLIFVMRSLALPTMIGHQCGAIGSVLPAIVHLALYAAWLSRPG